MLKAQSSARSDAQEHVLHVSYASGGDTLEMGFRTDWARPKDLWHDQQKPSQVFAYQRVNGSPPWFDTTIEVDNPLGQMGTAAVLTKGGVTLRTLEGQAAMLRVEPLSGTYKGINPFVEPTAFELTTPEGAVVMSEGPLGMARVTVRPKEGRLWVDYALLPPEGERGIERLQRERPHWFRPGTDVRAARGLSARALLVRGLGTQPTVVLNGGELAGPFAQSKVGGLSYVRVPILSE